MEFGNTAQNTIGIDSLVPVDVRESEPPNSTSSTFDCVWGLPPGHSGAWGTWRGLFPRDFRGIPSQVGIDTFVLDFGIFEILNDTLAIRWPDPSYLLDRCDSLILIDHFGVLGLPDGRLNMSGSDTLMIPDPADLAGPLQLWIERYGFRTPVEVGEPSGLAPGGFALVQNYPNPFNPGTSVVVQNSTRGLSSLKIYDILGRLTASLFEGTLEPGRHEFLWDAADAAAGVYVAHLTTADRSSTIKLILAR